MARRWSEARQSASPTSCAAHCCPNFPPNACVSMLQWASGAQPAARQVCLCRPGHQHAEQAQRGCAVGPAPQPALLRSTAQDERQEEGEAGGHQHAQVDEELSEVVHSAGQRGARTGQRGDGARRGGHVTDEEHEAATDDVTVDRGHRVVADVGARPERRRQDRPKRRRSRVLRCDLHLLAARVQDDQASVVRLHRLVEVDRDGARRRRHVRTLRR